MAIDKGTFVGGFAVYQEASKPSANLGELPAKTTNWRMACGEELHLVAGEHKKAPQASYRRLDYDHTEAQGPNGGIFAFGTREEHDVVTILYYPRMPEGDNAPQRFLPKVVRTKCSPVDRSLRGKIRLRLTPTNGSLATATEVFSTIEDAWIAHDLATALDENLHSRNINLHWHLEMIAAMVPPGDLPRILDEVNGTIGQRIGDGDYPLKSDFNQICSDPKKLEVIRKMMNRAWAVEGSARPK
jgi:hypothetical protein